MKKINYIDLLARNGIDNAHPGGFSLTRELLGQEQFSHGSNVLDVGCGTGQTSSYIARNHECNMYAVDNNPIMVKRASQRFRNEQADVRLFKADAARLPFPSDFFDIILAESVTIFTSIPDTIREYSRVIKPYGTLLDTEITAEFPLSGFELSEIGSVYGVKHVPMQDEWCSMFRYNGFAKINVLRGNSEAHAGGLTWQAFKDFMPHFYIMNKYRRKIGYRVYKCRLN